MLTILAVHNYYRSVNPSGENVAFEAETRLLSSHGHVVHKYVRNSDEIATWPASRRALLPSQIIWSWRTYADLKRIIRELRPDVVHFHNTFPLISPSAYTACRALRVPVVHTLHNFRPRCLSGVFFREGRICEECIASRMSWRGVLHRCYRKSFAYSAAVAGMQIVENFHGMSNVDLFITPSGFVREKYITAGLPPDRIVVKPNFVQVDAVPGNEARDRVVFVGRLSAEKGVRTLITAWEALPHVPLMLLGTGPDELELKSLAARQSESIQFVGAATHDRVLDCLRRARFMVLPSQCYEGLPLTLLEAFACGTPVLASGLGAVGEVVVSGHNGVLFRPGDASDLARKATELWSDSAYLGRLGSQARSDYEARFTPERSYQQLVNIYSQAIDRVSAVRSGVFVATSD